MSLNFYRIEGHVTMLILSRVEVCLSFILFLYLLESSGDPTTRTQSENREHNREIGEKCKQVLLIKADKLLQLS